MSYEISFADGDVTLAGSIWLPDGPGPHPGVVMVGGSGPTDRDNDTLFPPIREHVTCSGFAVLSYDKRGVGGSSGSWLRTGYDGLAGDCLTAVDALRSHGQVDSRSVGLFGHSEGGWVVLRAAAGRDDLSFVITNSTPGVSAAQQERWAMAHAAQAHGVTDAELDALLVLYDRLMVEARNGAGFAQVAAWTQADPAYTTLTTLGPPLSEPVWELMKLTMDHDPLPDLSRLRCPLLAIFGGADPVVPVTESIAAISTVACRRLTVELFPGAGHRINVDSDAPFAEGYLQTLTHWIQSTAARTPTV